jgi:hypothetical protein
VDPIYWSTEQKKAMLAWSAKTEARQTALKLRVLAASADIAEETGAKDASGWLRTELLVDKGAALPPWERLMGHGFTRLLETLDPASLPRHGGDATVVNVVISLEELRKDLGVATVGYDETNGATISAAEARRMACNATIIPWVLGGDSEVLDVGRASRFFQPI